MNVSLIPALLSSLSCANGSCAPLPPLSFDSYHLLPACQDATAEATAASPATTEETKTETPPAATEETKTEPPPAATHPAHPAPPQPATPPAATAAPQSAAAQEFTRSSGSWASWLVNVLAIGVALAVLYYARKLQQNLAEPEATEPAKTEETEVTDAAACQMKEMEAASNACTDENLTGLLLDRLEDIKLYSENTEKWAKEAVGLIDEIGVMRNAYSGINGEALDTISTILKTQMQDRNCELLDSDTWDPTIQRAIKISRILPKGSGTRIAVKHLSGIRIEGNLIRKQEIELEQEVVE